MGLSSTQEAALPRDWLPGAEPRQRVPDHGALVGDRGPAELAFKRLADRLRQPGAAADKEAAGLGGRKTREARDLAAPPIFCPPRPGAAGAAWRLRRHHRVEELTELAIEGE